jgi:hypothetical protein
MTQKGNTTGNAVQLAEKLIPNNWPTVVHDEAALDAAFIFVDNARAKAGLGGDTDQFTASSSLYRSSGSTGTGKDDPTLRGITVSGKPFTWKVYPRTGDFWTMWAQFGKYFRMIDVLQNYIGRTSGKPISTAQLFTVSGVILADVDTWHEVAVKLGGFTEESFAALVGLCEGVIGFYAPTLRESLDIHIYAPIAARVTTTAKVKTTAEPTLDASLF